MRGHRHTPPSQRTIKFDWQQAHFHHHSFVWECPICRYELAWEMEQQIEAP